MAENCKKAHIVSCKAYPNCNLTIKDGKEVILSPDDPSDKTRFWYKESDDEQDHVFALVNKETNQAIISAGYDQPVKLVPGSEKKKWIKDLEATNCPSNYTRISDYEDQKLILCAELGNSTDGCNRILTVNGLLRISRGQRDLWQTLDVDAIKRP